MSTQDSNTKKIAYGELHFYYPFKFDNKYSYTQIHKKIEKSPLLFTDEYQQKVIDSLGYSLVETFNDIKKEFEASSSLNNPCILKMSDYQKYKSMKCAPMSINPDDILLEIESGESSIKFYIKDADLELLNQRIIRLQEEYDISLKFYGHNFTNRQDRFLLLPLKIELENGKFTWLYPLIYLFENNMGILKLELPIFDSCIEPLLENDYDRFLTKIINKWNIKNYNSETTLSSIQNFYLSNLLDDIKIDMVSYSNELKNIILIDFDGRPQHINSIPNDVKEDLFRIICAPVPSRNNTTYTSRRHHTSKCSHFFYWNCRSRFISLCLNKIINSVCPSKSTNAISYSLQVNSSIRGTLCNNNFIKTNLFKIHFQKFFKCISTFKIAIKLF